MTSSLARAFAFHVQADMRDAAHALCRIASASHALGCFDDRDDSVTAARDLLAELLRENPSRFGEDGLQ
jgi:hypothetical protein